MIIIEDALHTSKSIAQVKLNHWFIEVHRNAEKRGVALDQSGHQVYGIKTRGPVAFQRLEYHPILWNHTIAAMSARISKGSTPREYQVMRKK